MCGYKVHLYHKDSGTDLQLLQNYAVNDVETAES